METVSGRWDLEQYKQQLKPKKKKTKINLLGFCGNPPVCMPAKIVLWTKYFVLADLKHTTTDLRLLYLLPA